MLVKGIIEEKVDIYSYRVRIPFLNKVEGDSNPTLTEDLSVAAISTIPGIHSVFEQGDVVFIDFENDDFSDPVILGLLDRTSDKTSYNNIDTTSLNVDLTANLPYETYIGDITPFELSSLSGIKGNLQEQLSIQENTIETYMCEYGVSDIEEIKYQYGQKRAIFVKYDFTDDGYKGTAYLTKINTTADTVLFEGIVLDNTDSGLRKLIEINVSKSGDNTVWDYSYYELVKPGLVYDTKTGISSIGDATTNPRTGLKGQLQDWFEAMPAASTRFFYITVTSTSVAPFSANSGIIVKIDKGSTAGTATFYGRLGANNSQTAMMANNGGTWSNFQNVSGDRIYKIQLSSSTGSGTKKYSIFYKLYKNTSTTNDTTTFLISGTDNFTSTSSDLWFVTVSGYSSSLRMLVRRLASSDTSSDPEFGYYLGDDGDWYIGIGRPNYSRQTTVALIQSEGNTWYPNEVLKEWSTSSTAPTGWVSVPAVGNMEAAPCNIIPYTSSAAYQTFFRYSKAYAGTTHLTFLIGGSIPVSSDAGRAGLWVLSCKCTQADGFTKIQLNALIPPYSYSGIEFGYYDDSEYRYFGIKRPTYAGNVRAIMIDGAQYPASKGFCNISSATQPANWTAITPFGDYLYSNNYYINNSSAAVNRLTNINVDPNNFGGLRKYISTTSMTGHARSNGHLIHLDWDNGNRWNSQLWISNAEDGMAMRAQTLVATDSDPGWTDWRYVLFQDQIQYAAYSSGTPTLTNNGDAVFIYK